MQRQFPLATKQLLNGTSYFLSLTLTTAFCFIFGLSSSFPTADNKSRYRLLLKRFPSLICQKVAQLMFFSSLYGSLSCSQHLGSDSADKNVNRKEKANQRLLRVDSKSLARIGFQTVPTFTEKEIYCLKYSSFMIFHK